MHTLMQVHTDIHRYTHTHSYMYKYPHTHSYMHCTKVPRVCCVCVWLWEGDNAQMGLKEGDTLTKSKRKKTDGQDLFALQEHMYSSTNRGLFGEKIQKMKFKISPIGQEANET